MVTVFHHPDQDRIGACDALTALSQHDSSQPTVVVIRRYSNTPYLPRGDVPCTLSGCGHFLWGNASPQFPLDRLHLCWQLPFSKSEVLLPHEMGEEGLKRHRSEEEHHLSDPISLSIPLLVPDLLLEECTQTKGGLDSHPACTKTESGLGCHPASTQTEVLGYHPSLKLLQEANQARAQLEWELIQETQELAERCECKEAKQARRHARQRAHMIDQTDATLQEVLSQASSMEAIKLLP